MAILCGACSFPVPAEAWNRDGGTDCPACRQRVEAFVFPAMERTRTGAAPEAIAAETEASCFFHPQSRAAVPCAECGRFLCNLCDIELDGRHLCPACFQSGVRSNKLETLETRRTMYDTIALAMVTWPALLIWPVIIGAPAALYLAIRRWRAPLSILPRTRVRFVVAALLALAEFAGIVFLIWTMTQLPRPRVVSR